MKSIIVAVAALVVLALAIGAALAATQYDIGRSVIGAGGDARASANYAAHDVVGEPAGGTSQSANYKLRSGFLPIAPGACTPGDANEDGIIDGRDVIRCKKIILGLEPGTCGADANLDGVVDGRDVIRIKKMILGIE
jgi:hypothetical protein